MKVTVPTAATLRIKPKDNTSLGIQSYDVDNAYPQRVRNIIAASGTGSACSELLKKYLRGRGFANEFLEEVVVNARGETLGDLHNLLAEDRSYFRGFAIHIGYNAALQVTSLTHVPFEYIRLGLPDDTGAVAEVAIHPDWAKQSGKPFNQADISWVDLYTDNPEKVLAQIDKAGGFDYWSGHVLYFSEAGHNTYPPAVCDSVLEDIITDAGIKVWKNRGVLTGFSANHILMYKGEFESDHARQQFIEDINQYQGADNAHKIMVVEVPTEESIPELKKIEQVSTDNLFQVTEQTVMENIIRRYHQPRTLHAIAQPGSLGLSKEWEEAKINYDERTEEERKRIVAVIGKVMALWHEGDPSAGNAFGYTVVPITGFSAKRETKTLSEVLPSDAVKEVRAIVESTNLSAEQKINIIVASYPVERKVAVSMVTGSSTWTN